MAHSSSKKSPKLSRSKLDSLVNFQELDQFCKLMARHQLGELEWQKGTYKIRLQSSSVSSQSAEQTKPVSSISLPKTPDPIEKPPSDSASVASSRQKQVLSPFVGTFYRSPSPEAEPYVRESQAIKAGDVLCIIEAMKLMNEIESEYSGKIVSILVENGQPVEFGEPLFLIET